MSDNLHNLGPRDPGLGNLSRFLATEPSDKVEPDNKEYLDYASFMARELTRGLPAHGELDFCID